MNRPRPWSWSLWAVVALAVTLPILLSAPRAAPTPPGGTAPAGEIPGLAAEEIQGLREGQGMGLARVAEVLGYPGPRHVLEAWEAGQLPLSSEQADRIRAIAGAMGEEARRLGARVLAAERELADALRDDALDEATLRARVGRIGALRGELRAAHLAAHLRTRAVLTAAQIARYAALRGYAPAWGHGHGH